MGRITDDPSDPGWTRGVDQSPVPQADVYLVLSADERAKGFCRPYRNVYRHLSCGTTTTMSAAIAQTYAVNPSFYGATYCVHCGMHRRVGVDGEFEWLDGSKVGA